MRVLIWTMQDGAPSQVAHSQIAIAPTISGADGAVYDLAISPLILPPGDYFLTVQGEATDWTWYGDKGAGFPSSDELSFSITDAPATPHADLREMHKGHDAIGWGIGQIGTPGSEWNQSIAHLPKDPESDNIINFLSADYGDDWLPIGMGGYKQSNQLFVSHIGEYDSSYPRQEWMPRTRLLEQLKGVPPELPEDFHLDPHGDRVFAVYAENGRLDGLFGIMPIQNEDGREALGEGDAHIYLVNHIDGEIMEWYKVNHYGSLVPGLGAGEAQGGVLKYYDLTKEISSYPGDDCCTSANARGGVMIPFLIQPDEIKAANGGPLPHQIGFTMNNVRLRGDSYWGAATHNPHRLPGHIAVGATGTQNPEHAVPYGVQMRLKQDFVIDPSLAPAARVILETLKVRGMTMVDGSNPGQLLASNDRLANTGWHEPEVNLGPNDMIAAGVRWPDFEVVTPTRKELMGGCTCRRTPAMPEFVTW